MSRGINPGAIGVRFGVLMDAAQEAYVGADFGRFSRAVRFMEVISAPYLDRAQNQSFREELRGLKLPVPDRNNRDEAEEVLCKRMEVMCRCLNHYGIYGFRQAAFGDVDDLGDDFDTDEPDDGSPDLGGGTDLAVMEGEPVEVEVPGR